MIRQLFFFYFNFLMFNGVEIFLKLYERVEILLFVEHVAIFGVEIMIRSFIDFQIIDAIPEIKVG